jgi:L,D-transpeptidase catalytic domain
VRVLFLATFIILVVNGPSGAREKVPAATSGWNRASLGAIDQHVLDLALRAVRCAVRSGAIADPSTLTVIDYSKPSTEKRLWVFDLDTRELLYEELVAHGQGSGEAVAKVFSNQPDTHASSIGLFRTEDTYVGKNGYSLRLTGLDEGFNDRARERAIVMHGAPYVSEDFVKANGRLGRSWGCPALREGVAREVIDRVRGNGILFAYYPDQEWLGSSRYLGDCAS